MPAASPDLTSIQNTLAGALDKLIALSASTALDNADAGAARAGLLAFAKDLVRELEGGESQTLEASPAARARHRRARAARGAEAPPRRAASRGPLAARSQR